MSKIAVVGSRDVVIGFKALGMECIYAEDAGAAAHAVNHLAREGAAVVFVTEILLKDMSEVVERYKNSATPAIIPIPDNSGSMGLGIQWLNENVEKAVGSNILLENED